jgi:cbb3-type cytochrome oxidase subunit 3
MDRFLNLSLRFISVIEAILHRQTKVATDQAAMILRFAQDDREVALLNASKAFFLSF